MKKSELRMMIREIVREEVAMSIKEVITEITQPSKQQVKEQVSKPKQKVIRKKHYTENSVLNEILNETAAEGEWKTMGDKVQTTDNMANVLAKSYGDMMNPNNNTVDVEQMAVESGVRSDKVPDHVEKALTRDYSDLVKAMKKKGDMKV